MGFFGIYFLNAAHPKGINWATGPFLFGQGDPISRGGAHTHNLHPARPAMTELPIIRISASTETQDALVVSCFPSTGMVSSIVAHFLIEQLELEFVGGIRHSELPALCLVKDGEPMPPIRFYAGDPICNIEHCDRVVLIVSEMQIENTLCLPLTEALLEWSKRARIGGGVLIDAFSIEEEEEGEEQLVGVGATAFSREMLGEMEVPLLPQAILGGMTGVLLGEGRRRGLDMMAILVGAEPKMPDARAAAKIIGALDKLLPNIDLDPAPLLEAAERHESELKGMMSSQLTKAPRSSDTSGMFA